MSDDSSASRRPDRDRPARYGGTVQPATDPGARVPPLRLLWFAFAATPIAWALNLVTGYAVQATVCDTVGPGARVLGLQSARAIPLLVAVLATLVGLAGVVVAYRCWRATGTGEENPEATVPAALGRSWFMAYAGLLSNVLFLLGILLVGITELALGPCASF